MTLRADLVLTDLHMPAVDGVELTRRLKQLANRPVVFIVTSDDTPEALARSLSAGADAFIVKTADLRTKLEAAMERFFPPDHEADNQYRSQTHELVTAGN